MNASGKTETKILSFSHDYGTFKSFKLAALTLSAYPFYLIWVDFEIIGYIICPETLKETENYPIFGDFKNTGYDFPLKKRQPAENYPIIGDLKNTGYQKACFVRVLRSQVSSF